MFNFKDFATEEVEVTEFVDSKKRLHKVKHSIVIGNDESHEFEERIAEDLYRIFAKK